MHPTAGAARFRGGPGRGLTLLSNTFDDNCDVHVTDPSWKTEFGGIQVNTGFESATVSAPWVFTMSDVPTL